MFKENHENYPKAIENENPETIIWKEIKDKIDFAVYPHKYEKKFEEFKVNDWEKIIVNRLPITDMEGNEIRIMNKSILAEIIVGNETLKNICIQAIKKRINSQTQDFLPLAVALQVIKEKTNQKDDFLNSEQWKTFIGEEILNNPKNLQEFKFILENYIRTETFPDRYIPIAKFLISKGKGLLKKNTFLDIGSSSGQALLPLTPLPKLRIIALDKIPEESNLNSFELKNPLAKIWRKRVKKIQGDALALPIKDSSIDEINFSYIFMHMNENSCQTSLKEAGRVLKEGGVAFIQPLKEYFVTDIALDEKKEKVLMLKKIDGQLTFNGYL